MQTISMLGHDEAWRAIEAIRAELLRRGQAAVIAVADAQGELLGLLRMDGAAVSSVQVAANKAFTAARMRRPSRAIGEAVRDPARRVDISYYGDRRYVGWAGGLPVMADGAVVGAVAVSGLRQDEDEELAALGIAALAPAESRAA